MNVLEFGCITDFKLKNNIDTPNTKAILFPRNSYERND